MVTYQFIQFFGSMGRKRNTLPNRTVHRPSGQDRIVWNGTTHYLGKHGSPEAEAAYRRAIRAIMDVGEPFPEPSKVTVRYLADRFMVHTKLSFKYGSTEPMAYQRAMNLLVEHHGDLPAEAMTPAKFTAMRNAWAERGASVRTVNKHHNQVLAAFRWGVTVELIPATVWHSLQSVQRLKPRRSPAKDPRVVGPVTWAEVSAIQCHVRPQVWVMIQVQWHTGMRSGEMLAMTPGQIEDGVYRPRKHKNAWRGHAREIPLGPKCRELLAEILGAAGPDDPIFPGYSPQSYGRAIRRACEAAGVAHWHPHQIRHSFAGRVRKAFGLDAAQSALGHATARVTEIYAKNTSVLAKKVSDEIG